MICFDISLFIVAAFLVLTLVVGIYFSRKKTTFREYAVGNKQFATATLVATVLATCFGGGGLVRNIETVYALGLYWIVILLLGCYVGLWVISRLALRMGPFMSHLSMAETIGSIYGKYPRIISSLVGICSCVAVITGQINVMSKSLSICFTSTNPYGMPILATLLLIFYSAFGGIRAVTYTDVLQFITFSIIIPLLAWFMFIKVGKPIAVIVPILQSQSKFQFSTVFHFDKQLVGMLLVFLAFIFYPLQPDIVQRAYMTSGTIQAQKTFSYANLFMFIISSFIVLIALFVFIGAPDLPKTEIWSYIIAHIPPIFKGFVAISLLAMAMSTADSCLNVCSVMMSHDIVKSLYSKKMPDTRQLKIARWTTLVVGLLAMLLAFCCQDLLKLMLWSIAYRLPITVAPFILSIFGFRGTSRTALIGMATGVLTILAWNKWVKSITDIDGAFIAMVANGLSMMAVHYLLKQPESAGWVGPDDTFKQIQQENARKRAERKEAIKNVWANRKIILSKLMPSHTTMVCVGCYLFITGLLYWFIMRFINHRYWLTFHLFGSACFLSYPFLYDISKKIMIRAIPRWFIGLGWLMGLAIYIPFNVLWNWLHFIDPIFITSLNIAHCAIILWVLPLYLGIGVVAATLLLSIYPIYIGLSYSVLCSLFPLFLLGLLLFAITICLKVKLGHHKSKILYFENQEKIRENQNLKASLYEAALVSSNKATFPKPRGYGFILTQVVRKVEESISFLDSNMPIYKQDLQSIINKFYDWVVYFNKKEMAKDHALLQPTKITLDKLIRKVEVALSQEVADPPRLLIEKTSDPNGGLCSDIVCDVNQVVYVLVQTVLRVGKLEDSNAPVVRIQLHPTVLQFKQTDPVDGSDPVWLLFQATALVISQATTPADLLPKVKGCYADVLNCTASQERKDAPPSIDLQQQTISNVIGAHYGCLEDSSDQKQPTMLLVLPNDVTEILSKITAQLPIDALTLETPVTPKEQADSMMALMQFHDYVCKSSLQEDPIDMKTISGLLLLLRKHFGFRRHESGQLFYVRAVGIATLVVEWVFHSPKVIYAALLYGLVRRTCLPLSYIKEHYNFGVYAFVLNVVGIDKRQSLDHPSLLHVKNRLKEAIKEEHVQLSVLFIKLAERLYDLRHAGGYIHLTEVQHMAQETLAIDVQIANTYLGPEIGVVLEAAAKQALKVCKTKEAEREKEKNKDQDKDS